MSTPTARCLSLMVGLIGTSLSVAQAQAPTSKQVELVQPGVATGRRVALVIGVERYQAYANLPALEYADDDAHAVARALIESGSFSPGDIVLMTSDSLDPALVPTRVNVLAQLQRLKRQRGLDLLLVYYSGHGAALGSGPGRENYLLPEDFNPELYSQSAIEVDEVVASVEATLARNRVLVFDACRTTGAKGDPSEGAVWDRPTYRTSAGTRLLYSAEFGRPSYESRERGHGAFTAYLLEALEGEADGYNGSGPLDGVISVGEAYAYVFDGLTRPTVAHPTQTPYLGGEGAGSDVALVAVRPEVQYPGCPTDPRELEEVLDHALTACAGPDELETYLAQEAWSALSCLDGRLTPELAARWHYVDAMREENNLSHARAARGWQVAGEVLDAKGLSDPRSEACRAEAEQAKGALGRAPMAAPTVVVQDPRPGTRLYVNGARLDEPVQALPLVLQARWGDETWSTPMVVREQGDLPTDLAAAFPVPDSLAVNRSRRLLLGSAGSLIVSASLLSAGRYVDLRSGMYQYLVFDDPDPDPDRRDEQAERLERQWDLANALWIGGEVAGGVALGLGYAGIRMKF